MAASGRGGEKVLKLTSYLCSLKIVSAPPPFKNTVYLIPGGSPQERINIPNDLLMVCLLSNVQRRFSFVVSDALVDIDLMEKILNHCSIASSRGYPKGVIT